jgi:hypothetical protein
MFEWVRGVGHDVWRALLLHARGALHRLPRAAKLADLEHPAL